MFTLEVKSKGESCCGAGEQLTGSTELNNFDSNFIFIFKNLLFNIILNCYFKLSNLKRVEL